jgi:hypothetical protein
MKPIYISRPEPKSRARFYIIGGILFFLVALRAMSPLLVENMINHAGSDEKGYAFRVDDVDLKIWRGVVNIAEARVYNAKTDQNFVEAHDLTFNFDPTKIFDDKKIFTVSGKEVDIILSKDFLSEVERVKNEGKNKVKREMYLDKVEAEIGKINVQQQESGGKRTLITLEDTQALFKDLGVGSVNKDTEFEVESKIAGGGNIQLQGKTILEKKETPWVIEGKMEDISSAVIEKLAGNKLPFEVEKANINAEITAHSSGGQISGVLRPHIKDFKLTDKKDETFLKRNIAKVGNYIFDKTKGEDEELSMKLPFTLNENFTLNLPETIDKITK